MCVTETCHIKTVVCFPEVVPKGKRENVTVFQNINADNLSTVNKNSFEPKAEHVLLTSS